MTRPDSVRFLRTDITMAYPDGRLLALRDGRMHVLAPDGWTSIGPVRATGAVQLSREEAEDWCERAGWDLNLLDALPVT
ncbi:MAG: hypothetical protein ACRDRN_05180 [Sciscionella sp.]